MNNLGILYQKDGNVTVPLPYFQRLAQAKGRAVVQCEICGISFMVEDKRDYKHPLCKYHQSFRGLVDRMARGRFEEDPKAHLDERDRDRLRETRTVRQGPFFNPKNLSHSQ